jgi:hypothetical protein
VIQTVCDAFGFVSFAGSKFSKACGQSSIPTHGPNWSSALVFGNNDATSRLAAARSAVRWVIEQASGGGPGRVFEPDSDLGH